MARWLGFSQVEQAWVVFPQDLGKEKVQKGNREMARNQLQCKPGCFLTVQQEMMCLIP